MCKRVSDCNDAFKCKLNNGRYTHLFPRSPSLWAPAEAQPRLKPDWLLASVTVLLLVPGTPLIPQLFPGTMDDNIFFKLNMIINTLEVDTAISTSIHLLVCTFFSMNPKLKINHKVKIECCCCATLVLRVAAFRAIAVNCEMGNAVAGRRGRPCYSYGGPPPHLWSCSNQAAIRQTEPLCTVMGPSPYSGPGYSGPSAPGWIYIFLLK